MQREDYRGNNNHNNVKKKMIKLSYNKFLKKKKKKSHIIIFDYIKKLNDFSSAFMLTEIILTKFVTIVSSK